MKDFAGIIVVGIIAIVLLFNVFGPDKNPLRGMTGSNVEDTYNELPDEPDRSEIINTIDQFNGDSNNTSSSIEELIQRAFPLLDTVQSDNGVSKIYMTRELTLPEVADQLSDQVQPQEISERQSDKQVLVYPETFVIIQESSEEPGLVTIELAGDQFVRNNYSPSFFDGLLAYYILDEVLDVDDWFKKRRNTCRQTNDCYGGYGVFGGLKSNNSGSFRGSSNRGGGPGTGK
ncbi:DUF4247 domain-containing protein [Halobacillus salinus]|uniref:DUF4247 domain-containing protein n=1 Tax=Halobacillus salinus TaxID=192814 RepID=A0A4Z0H0X5_9BACI|nr:DUF4247 domain-containing protein [Halobacillus salinus]TGB04063.1 DUF4247 domain-containing protein [Halobacillus salinus]